MNPDPDYGLFAKVVDAGSFSAAGRQLNLSPAMVSKRIARLERRLGVRLFHRTTRALSLTASAQRFHQDVAAILAAIERAESRLVGVQGRLSGPLRVSAPTSFGRLHVAPNIAPFLNAHPEINLELDLTDAFVDFTADQVDVAIRITRQIGPAFVATRLADNRRLFCASPEYLERFGSPRDLQDLNAHRLLAASGQSPWRVEGPNGFAEIEVKSAIQTNSSEVVRELVTSGMGIALRSTWDICGELATGALVRILPQFEGAKDVGIYAMHPHAPFTPSKVTGFSEYLRSMFEPTPPWELLSR